MKIKYRRFDDNDYTEVECDGFTFKTKLDKSLHLYPYWYPKDTKIYKNIDGTVFYKGETTRIIKNVCEVHIEEL